MATPMTHALCSASSSERWLNCTAAPRFEADFPAGTSTYAEEGRLAHSICEISAQFAFELITKRKYNAELKKLKADPLFSEEMLRTAEVYVQHLIEKSMTYDAAPYVAQEVKVDFSEYVPDGFGTCDCIMIGGNTLNITDYKHGRGVEVSAVNNSQMRLYALGAIKKYSMLYAVKTVSMAIVQPRITDVISEETITVDELMAWGESIKPLAMKAYSGMGDFKPGIHFKDENPKPGEEAMINMTFDLLEMKGQDLGLVVTFIMQFGLEMGMFDDPIFKGKEDVDDE